MDNQNFTNASINLLTDTLNEILTWIRITSYPVVREIMVREFDNAGDSDEVKNIKRKVYSLTDGKCSSRESLLYPGKKWLSFTNLGARGKTLPFKQIFKMRRL